MREPGVWSLGLEDPLEKGMAPHSSILAWRIPWTEDLGKLQFVGSQRVGHDWVTDTFTLYSFLKRKEKKKEKQQLSCFSITYRKYILKSLPYFQSPEFIAFLHYFPFLPLIPMKSPKQMDSAFRKHTSTSLITGIPFWFVMLILDLRSPCLEFSQKRKKNFVSPLKSLKTLPVHLLIQHLSFPPLVMLISAFRTQDSRLIPSSTSCGVL